MIKDQLECQVQAGVDFDEGGNRRKFLLEKINPQVWLGSIETQPNKEYSTGNFLQMVSHPVINYVKQGLEGPCQVILSHLMKLK